MSKENQPAKRGRGRPMKSSKTILNVVSDSRPEYLFSETKQQLTGYPNTSTPYPAKSTSSIASTKSTVGKSKSTSTVGKSKSTSTVGKSKFTSTVGKSKPTSTTYIRANQSTVVVCPDDSSQGESTPKFIWNDPTGVQKIYKGIDLADISPNATDELYYLIHSNPTPRRGKIYDATLAPAQISQQSATDSKATQTSPNKKVDVGTSTDQPSSVSPNTSPDRHNIQQESFADQFVLDPSSVNVSPARSHDTSIPSSETPEEFVQKLIELFESNSLKDVESLQDYLCQNGLNSNDFLTKCLFQFSENNKAQSAPSNVFTTSAGMLYQVVKNGIPISKEENDEWKKDLIQKREREKGKGYKCTDCTNCGVQGTVLQLENHLLKKNKLSIQCDECKNIYETFDKLAVHKDRGKCIPKG